ncbi:hypothetical protein DFJ74DRAFT_254744 [Hyaloraphidium curvatum]|nr:hypothetical protein DFJ74DRAFT_254744 [Hyaloraphidium curvatum]
MATSAAGTPSRLQTSDQLLPTISDAARDTSGPPSPSDSQGGDAFIQADGDTQFVTEELCVERGFEVILDLSSMPRGEFVLPVLKDYFTKARTVLNDPRCPTRPGGIQEVIEKLGIPEGFAKQLSRYERRELSNIPRGSQKFALFRCLAEGHITLAKIYDRLDKGSGCAGCAGKAHAIGRRFQDPTYITPAMFERSGLEVIQTLWPAPEGEFVDNRLASHLKVAHELMSRKLYGKRNSKALQRKLEDLGVPGDLAAKLSKFETKALSQVTTGSNNFVLMRCKRAQHITICKINDKTTKRMGCGGCSNVSGVIASGGASRKKKIPIDLKDLESRGLELILDLATPLSKKDFADPMLHQYLELADGVLSDPKFISLKRREERLLELGVPKRYAYQLGNFETRQIENVSAGTDRFALFRCKDHGHITLSKIYDKFRKRAGCAGCDPRFARDVTEGEVPRPSSIQPLKFLLDAESIRQDQHTQGSDNEMDADDEQDNGIVGEADAPKDGTEQEMNIDEQRMPSLKQLQEELDQIIKRKSELEHEIAKIAPASDGIVIESDTEDVFDWSLEKKEAELREQDGGPADDNSLDEVQIIQIRLACELAETQRLENLQKELKDDAIEIDSEAEDLVDYDIAWVKTEPQEQPPAGVVPGQGTAFFLIPGLPDRTPIAFQQILELNDKVASECAKWLQENPDVEKGCQHFYMECFQQFHDRGQLLIYKEPSFAKPFLDGTPFKNAFFRMDIAICTADKRSFVHNEFKVHDTQSRVEPPVKFKRYYDIFPNRIKAAHRFGFSPSEWLGGKSYKVLSLKFPEMHVPVRPNPDGCVDTGMWDEVEGRLFSFPQLRVGRMWRKAVKLDKETEQVVELDDVEN